MGCVRFSLAGNTAKVWGESGRDLLGSGPGPIPQILSLTCLLFGACPISSYLSARWGELRLCGQDGKPKAYVTPGSSLEEGISRDLLSSQVAIPREQPLLYEFLFLESHELFQLVPA